MGAKFIAGAGAATLLLAFGSLAVSLVASGPSEISRIWSAVRYKVFGIDVGDLWSSYSVDAVILWIAAFVSLNAIIFRRERIFVSAHVRENHCSRRTPRGVRQTACVIAKTSVIAALAPLVLVLAFLRRWFMAQRNVDLFWLTFEPDDLTSTLKYALLLTAMTFACVAFLAQRFLPG